MYRSIYLSISLSVCLSVCLSIYLSICKLENQAILRYFLIFKVDNIKSAAILRDFLIFQSWQHQKLSNSPRLPQCLNVPTSKAKQLCETSSFFEVDNIKNEAILRDFLIFRSWQHQKRSNYARTPHFRIWQHQKRMNSARLPSKMESWV